MTNIIGSNLAELLNGTAAADIIWANEGDDTVRGQDGDDTIYGGDGNDSLHGDAGADLIGGDAGNDSIDGGTGDDTVYGGTGNDALWGDAGNDLLSGGDGSDVIYGNDGNDIIFGGTSGDLANSNDTIYGGDGNDSIYGGSDDLTGTDHDFIDAGNGNDFVDAGPGDDTVYAGDGNDTLWLEDGKDLATGGNGNDYILGDNGDDTVYAESGNDTVYGGDGNDKLDGGEGNDFLGGDAGNDTLDGAEGNDTLFGYTGDDHLYGWTGDDLLSGEDGNDTLEGEEGNDQLFGGNGQDLLKGGAGNDVLDGGDGNDTLYGDDPADPIKYGQNLVVNGSFEADVIADHGGNWQVYAGGLTGWHSSMGDGPELQKIIVASDGKQYLELDSNNNSNLYQDIATHGTGTFHLEFDYSPRAGVSAESNKVEVYWNGHLIDTLSGDTQGWTTKSYDVAGGGDMTRLEFRAVGTNDSFGGFIDNVKVMGETGGSHDADGGNDTIYGGNGDDTAYGNGGSDYIYGGAGNDTIYGDDNDSSSSNTIANHITVKGLSGAGADVPVTFTENNHTLSFGQNVTGGNFENEVDFLKTVNGNSAEGFVVDFGANNVTSATVNLKYFYAATPGIVDDHDETGSWKAYDHNGNLVGQGDFTATQHWTNATPDGLFTVTIDPGVAFEKLVLTPTDDGSNNVITVGDKTFVDNSDFHVDSLTYTTKDYTPSADGGNDVLFGNEGNDTIYGMAGNDTLTGGADDGTASSCQNTFQFSAGDNLFGGSGNDIFVYGKGDGVDAIHDFQTGADKIDLTDLGTNFAALHIADVTGGALIYFDTNEAIFVAGHTAADLHNSDFVF